LNLRPSIWPRLLRLGKGAGLVRGSRFEVRGPGTVDLD
jgi:hypothetical protein